MLLIQSTTKRTVEFRKLLAVFSGNHTDDRSRQEEADLDGGTSSPERDHCFEKNHYSEKKKDGEVSKWQNQRSESQPMR